MRFPHCRHNVQPAQWSEPQPVHICCLIDPERARTLADPSSQDKAYVCSDIINARAEKTMADEFSGRQAQWTTASKTPVSWKVFRQLRAHTLAKHRPKMWSEGARVSEAAEGRDGRCWEHQVITSVYMKLCVLEMLRGKKGALFFQAAWNVWRAADACFISICDPTPGLIRWWW